jgi:hypothetical protein
MTSLVDSALLRRPGGYGGEAVRRGNGGASVVNLIVRQETRPMRVASSEHISFWSAQCLGSHHPFSLSSVLHPPSLILRAIAVEL